MKLMINQGLPYSSVPAYRAQLGTVRYSVSSGMHRKKLPAGEEIADGRRIAWAKRTLERGDRRLQQKMQRSLCFCRIAKGDAGDAGGLPAVKAATTVVDASGEEEVVVARLETMEIGELPCSEYCEEGRLLQDGVWLDCSLIIGRGRRRGFCERCGVVGGPWSIAVRNNVVGGCVDNQRRRLLVGRGRRG
ncbi:hypothetical protein B296_00058562 [Ensete ventricosum]|uniref:Uncharacterized protein n=1 Tax=Ensete ventricosum TaxID=4639 RepID=A0A426XLM3_ENSVE|nr:hypothetical protein B296_00058562 [Ensete ventricosum]